MDLLYPHVVTRSIDGDFSGASLQRACAVSIVLTSVIMGFRFYAKKLSGGRYGCDDGLIMAAYVANIGLCAIGIGE